MRLCSVVMDGFIALGGGSNLANAITKLNLNVTPFAILLDVICFPNEDDCVRRWFKLDRDLLDLKILDHLKVIIYSFLPVYKTSNKSLKK